MKIFMIYPPSIPIYFNAGYHLDLWVVKAYLEKNTKEKIFCKDASLLNQTWSDVLLDISEKYDCYILQNDFDDYDGIKTIVNFIIEISPESKTITYGRLSHANPEIFKKLELDCIVYNGDYESSIESYIQYMNKEIESPRGVHFKEKGIWKKSERGKLLDDSEIVFPNVQEIPYEDYNKLYLDKKRKFPGVPNKKELIIPVSRGCPNCCPFCLVPKIQGHKERRKSVDDVLKYLDEAKKKINFDYVNFYSAHFTLDGKWVFELCEKLKKRDIKWKCCTSINQVNKKMIKKMADAGCFKISFGIETLSQKLQKKYLSKNKLFKMEDLKEKYKLCSDKGVEINWLIIVGFPGEKESDLLESFEGLKRLGGEIRPAVYTDYSRISSQFGEQELIYFNRKLALGEINKSIIGKIIYEK